MDALCHNWDNITGVCTDCYLGYRLSGGKCIQFSNAGLASTSDPHCAEWTGRNCSKCADRSYFGPIGFCIPVSDYCRTWDKYDGYCLSCYLGYTLQPKGGCVVADEASGPSDLGCNQFDWKTYECVTCSFRWVLKNGTCVKVSDYCKSFNSTSGLCSACYSGYDLINGDCVYSPLNLSDIGCRLWDWEQQKCL